LNKSVVTTPFSHVLVMAWAIMLAILLVFAGDVNKWAQAAETTSQQLAAPAAEVLYTTASSGGIVSAREAVEQAVQGFYADQPELCGSGQQVASAPEITPQANLQLSLPAPAPQQVQAQGVGPVSKPRPTRVLIVGASSIQEGLGTELERQLEGYQGVTVMRFGQYSSGLARPDYFDWSAKVAELTASFKPDLVIAQFGENDCQGMGTLQGTALAKFGTDTWDTEYGKRVSALVKLMEEGGSHAVMIGIPIMRSKSFSQQVSRLNDVTKRATEAAGGIFLSTWNLTVDKNGKYMSSVEFEGKTRMIRAGDGIHLSNHGANYVATKLCDRLEQFFTLTRKSS